jgi:hypothetical protein
MNPTTAKRLVLVSMLGMLGISLYRQRSLGSYPRIYAVGVVGLGLSVLADFAPAIAGPFALLVLAGFLTPGGQTRIVGGVSSFAANIGGGSVPGPAGGGGGVQPQTATTVQTVSTSGQASTTAAAAGSLSSTWPNG